MSNIDTALERLTSVPEVGARISDIDGAVASLGEACKAMGLVVDDSDKIRYQYETFTNPMPAVESINTKLVYQNTDIHQANIEKAFDDKAKNADDIKANYINTEVDILKKLRDEVVQAHAANKVGF